MKWIPRLYVSVDKNINVKRKWVPPKHDKHLYSQTLRSKQTVIKCFYEEVHSEIFFCHIYIDNYLITWYKSSVDGVVSRTRWQQTYADVRRSLSVPIVQIFTIWAFKASNLPLVLFPVIQTQKNIRSSKRVFKSGCCNTDTVLSVGIKHISEV